RHTDRGRANGNARLPGGSQAAPSQLPPSHSGAVSLSLTLCLVIDGWLAVPLSCVLVVLHFQQAAECLLAICIQWPPAPSCAERRSSLHCQYPPHIETLSLLSARQARHPDSSVVWPRCRDTASLPSSFSPRWMA